MEIVEELDRSGGDASRPLWNGGIERIERGEAPTLVVSGDRDPATPPEHGRSIADSVPGARFENLAGASHLANIERPEAVTRLILDHLEAG